MLSLAGSSGWGHRRWSDLQLHLLTSPCTEESNGFELDSPGFITYPVTTVRLWPLGLSETWLPGQSERDAKPSLCCESDARWSAQHSVWLLRSSPWTGRIGITGDLVRKASSWTQPLTYGIRNSGGACKQALRVILMPTKVWKPLQQIFISDLLSELSQNIRASLGAPCHSLKVKDRPCPRSKRMCVHPSMHASWGTLPSC